MTAILRGLRSDILYPTAGRRESPTGPSAPSSYSYHGTSSTGNPSANHSENSRIPPSPGNKPIGQKTMTIVQPLPSMGDCTGKGEKTLENPVLRHNLQDFPPIGGLKTPKVQPLQIHRRKFYHTS